MFKCTCVCEGILIPIWSYMSMEAHGWRRVFLDGPHLIRAHQQGQSSSLAWSTDPVSSHRTHPAFPQVLVSRIMHVALVASTLTTELFSQPENVLISAPHTHLVSEAGEVLSQLQRTFPCWNLSVGFDRAVSVTVISLFPCPSLVQESTRTQIKEGGWVGMGEFPVFSQHWLRWCWLHLRVS